MTKTKLLPLLGVVLCSTAFAAAQKPVSASKPSRSLSQSAAAVETSEHSGGLASERASSLLGKMQLSAQAGATVGSATTGVVSAKTSYKLPVTQFMAYTEAGLGAHFNTSGAIIPFDFGARAAINLPDLHAIQPFVHLSMGPGFATTGQSVRFHMFAGPGMIYKMAENDLRFDMGVVLIGDKASFQMLGGVAL